MAQRVRIMTEWHAVTDPQRVEPDEGLIAPPVIRSSQLTPLIALVPLKIYGIPPFHISIPHLRPTSQTRMSFLWFRPQIGEGGIGSGFIGRVHTKVVSRPDVRPIWPQHVLLTLPIWASLPQGPPSFPWGSAARKQPQRGAKEVFPSGPGASRWHRAQHCRSRRSTEVSCGDRELNPDRLTPATQMRTEHTVSCPITHITPALLEDLFKAMAMSDVEYWVMENTDMDEEMPQ